MKLAVSNQRERVEPSRLTELERLHARMLEREHRERREATAMLDALWELSGDLLALLDAEGRLTRINERTWHSLAGWGAEALVGARWVDLAVEADRERTAAVFSVRGVRDFAHRVAAANGVHLIVCWNVSPLASSGRALAIGRVCSGAALPLHNLCAACPSRG